MFVIVRTERPRDEVAPLILHKISAATGGVGILSFFYELFIKLSISLTIDLSYGAVPLMIRFDLFILG